jgi:hypothetical protein
MVYHIGLGYSNRFNRYVNRYTSACGDRCVEEVIDRQQRLRHEFPEGHGVKEAILPAKYLVESVLVCISVY